MDKQALLSRRLPTEEVTLLDGGVITVRALSRAEALQVRERSEDPALEAIVLSMALTEPALTQEEASLWISGAPSSEILGVISVIQRLSGLSQETPKSGDEGGVPEAAERARA